MDRGVAFSIFVELVKIISGVHVEGVPRCAYWILNTSLSRAVYVRDCEMDIMMMRKRSKCNECGM